MLESLYFSINPDETNLIKGHLVQFWLIVIIGLVIWIGIYQLLSRTSSKKKKFRYWPSFSKSSSFLISSVIGLTICVYAYYLNWNDFFRLDLTDDGLQLFYYLPERTVYVKTDNIIDLYTETVKRKLINYRLIIKTGNGIQYTSSLMDAGPYEDNLDRLSKFLGRKILSPDME